MPTSYDERWPVGLSVRLSRATHSGAVTAATRSHFRPKLSPLSQSRAVRVIEELRALNRSQSLHFVAHPGASLAVSSATGEGIPKRVTTGVLVDSEPADGGTHRFLEK